ncbi:extradiol ring-cleavage dioxygenase [Pseudonocardia sp. H11422]|uniref:DODA-type extradiol aromatic ring-opening family dioxygenase n=1 Tax=Pseudonocardia sp. H11422 TaxID=2835866 RepID=UPI001BDD371C|nr:extradiol ring-cleavage dioxygenase [Pseudonocardia sp. H11422]
MGDILGLGLTHYPPLAGTDEHMADILRWTLADPDIPAERKDPASWPELMRSEWADDGGTAAAGRHRAQLREGLARCRAELDAFAPDVVVVWGDDQYETFREEVVPAFCVMAYEDMDIRPFAPLAGRGAPNAWDRPDDMPFTVRGAPDIGREIAGGLLAAGFDVAYSYRKPDSAPFPHAMANTQLYLDYDHAGTRFPYPIVPIAVNCYGRHVIARKGGMVRYADIENERLDPPGPSPARCYALGAALAAALRDGPHRVALVASSSWSHAFLVDKAWHLRPDTPADRALYESLAAGDYEAWLKTTGDDVVAAGQQEMLNWFCLMGAMAELGHRPSWSSFVETDVFNSNKCFAVFEGAR